VQDDGAGNSEVDPSANAAGIVFTTPSTLLDVEGNSNNNDTITVTASSFVGLPDTLSVGALTINTGGGGTSILNVDDSLALGDGSNTGTLNLTGDTINLNAGTIDTTLGTTAGSATFTGSVSLGSDVAVTAGSGS